MDELMPSLPLQMCLYFNVCITPFWLLIRIFCLFYKYLLLTKLYKILMITVLIVMSPMEIIRLYLGYSGNFREKVPELAGFWLITLFLQFPLHSWFIFHSSAVIIPVERVVDIIMMAFIVLEIGTGYVALNSIAHNQATKFQQRMRKVETFDQLPHFSENLQT